ncbi:MAG: hypothetical protein IJW09_07020 [Clostridia bacterium]|nr:hypothetical protein [Clostridia bacterium]
MKSFFARLRVKRRKTDPSPPTLAHISRYPDGEMSFCPHLRPIYQVEMARGNTIAYINLNAGSKRVKVVYLSKALQTYDNLDECVKEGTYNDYHFPFEKRYHCDKCRWMIAGPLEDGQKNWHRPDAKEIVAPEDMVPPRVELLPDGRWRREACFTNVINPRVIATPEDIVFEDDWQQYTYSDDWQILPTTEK